jgi:hypothetical protein
MSSSVEQWSKECHQGSGLCGNSDPTNWCSGQQPCTGGGVGDLRILLKTPKEIEASETKFWGTWTKDGALKLIGCGMLAAAGLRPGDVLMSVQGFKLANRFDRKTILTWQFKEELIRVVYLRENRLHTSAMDNPKGK